MAEYKEEDFQAKKQEINDTLREKGFYTETDNDSISVALTKIGLSGVWAEITREEIEYQLD